MELPRRSEIDSDTHATIAGAAATVGSWEWDIASDTVGWSGELCRIYGLEHAVRHTFETFLEAVHRDDRALVRTIVQDAFATGEPFRFEHRIIRPDGTQRVLLARGDVTLGADRTPVAMHGTGQDITERDRA